MNMDTNQLQQLLGGEAESLLTHKCNTIGKKKLHLPGPVICPSFPSNRVSSIPQADIIKQKLPETDGGYNDPELKGFGKPHPLVYETLTTDHPIDLTRYQLMAWG